MADLKISELATLAGIDLSGADLLPIVDLSGSETKKITVQDALGYGVTLIADASIPGAKVLFNAGSIAGSKIASGGIGTTQLADDGVTAAKLADESTVDLVTTLPATGGFVGQLALDTDDLKLYCWDGSAWQNVKGAGSINAVSGDSSGIVNIVATTTGDSVAITATFDATGAANQFLAGPTNAGGAVSYRTIDPTDLPTASTTAKGAVQVNGEGLRMDGSVIEVDNDVAASATHSVVTYSAKGLITGGRAIQGGDLPVATSSTNGVVQPGTGLTVTGAGVLNHTNSITAATATKITYDAQGHVTGGGSLAEGDIPNLPASKITSGTLDVALIGGNAITGSKLANASTVKFGGAGSTAGVVTFPSPDFQGQYFFDALNGDLYLYDGSAWQPITITAGELIYGGTYDASTNKVKSVTQAGTAAGLVANAALPNASNGNLRYYLVVSDSGTGVAPAPAVALAPPDMIVSGGTSWELIDVSSAIAGQTASNISFTPYGNISATNAQTALQELDDEKLPKAGGTVTGELLIGTAGSLAFEGSTDNTYETHIAVVDPTADRTITLPDASGTVITTGDTGTVTSTMIADGTIVNGDINASAAIAYSKLSLTGSIVDADLSNSAAISDSKLATISTAGKVANSATTATSANTASAIVARDASGNFTAGTITATTFSGSGASLTSLPAGNLSGTIPSGVLGNSTLFVGTTAVALNRASADQALTGILSLTLPGATSGTITVTPASIAGTTAITIPATTGTLITTGDSATVTNAMLAGSIADSKLSTISTAGKVSGSAITSGTIGGSTAVSTSGAIATTGTLAVGQSSAATNTDLDVSGTYAQVPVAVSALDIDCSTGNYFTKTINGNSTFTVSNVPASRSYSFTLELTHTSGSIAWFSGVIWPGGTLPGYTSGKTHLFMFQTSNGGVTWRGSALTNYAS